MPRDMRLGRLAALTTALCLSGCYDFTKVGPEDPPVMQTPMTVTIQVSYVQPSFCPNVRTGCSGPVTFQASWLNSGAYLNMQAGAGHTWSLTIPNVPVNWPGLDPYRVYAVDPYLAETPTQGVSADRLTVAGEKITQFDNAGNPREQGLIFIDASGKGRTPTR